MGSHRISFAFVVVGMYAVYWWARSRRSLKRFSEKLALSSAVNPLAKEFTNQRIKLSDFYHPWFHEYDKVIFRNCELYGPCNVFFSGHVTLNGGGNDDTEIVIVYEGAQLRSVVVFKNATFIDCRWYRVTFYVHADQARRMKAKMRIPQDTVISDGKFGVI